MMFLWHNGKTLYLIFFLIFYIENDECFVSCFCLFYTEVDSATHI